MANEVNKKIYVVQNDKYCKWCNEHTDGYDYFLCLSITITAIILIFNVSVVASTSLDTITGNPAHSDIFSSDYFYTTIDPAVSSFQASMIIESTPFACQNKIGIFSSSDASVKLELFGRCDSPGDSVTVNFDHNTNEAWIDESNKVAIGPTFGFYLDTTERLFYQDVYYSDPVLNEDDDYQTQILGFWCWPPLCLSLRCRCRISEARLA